MDLAKKVGRVPAGSGLTTTKKAKGSDPKADEKDPKTTAKDTRAPKDAMEIQGFIAAKKQQVAEAAEAGKPVKYIDSRWYTCRQKEAR